MKMNDGDAPGHISFNLPDRDYRSDPAVSKSGLDLINEHPARYRWVMLEKHPIEQTAAMRIGSAFDSALLTPTLFTQDYIIAPEGARRGSKAWEEFEQSAIGKTILKTDEYDTVQRMREATLTHPVARLILKDGDPQVSLFWSDAITKQRCKARVDYLRRDRILVDVKSTAEGGAAPDTFQRTAFAMRYHVQAAFYSDGLSLLEEADAEAFMFIVVERTPPFAVAVYTLDRDFMRLGREAYRKDLERYAACVAANDWPAYPLEIQQLSAPAWAITRSKGESL